MSNRDGPSADDDPDFSLPPVGPVRLPEASEADPDEAAAARQLRDEELAAQANSPAAHIPPPPQAAGALEASDGEPRSEADQAFGELPRLVPGGGAAEEGPAEAQAADLQNAAGTVPHVDVLGADNANKAQQAPAAAAGVGRSEGTEQADTRLLVAEPTTGPPPLEKISTSPGAGAEEALLSRAQDELAGYPGSALVRRASEACSQRAERAVRRYSRLLLACPKCLIVLYGIFFAGLLAAAWRPFELDVDFSTFVRADGDIQRRQAALARALDERMDLVQLTGRRLDDGSASPEAVAGPARLAVVDHETFFTRSSEGAGNVFIRKELHIFYQARTVAFDVFDSRVLRNVRDFEARLRSLRGWRRLCNRSAAIDGGPVLCDPGESFAALAWPTQGSASNHERFTLTFDGQGSEMLALPVILAHLATQGQAEASRDFTRYFPEEYATRELAAGGASGLLPTAIRSRFTFDIKVGTLADSLQQMSKQAAAMRAEYEDMFEKEVYPLIVSASEDYEYVSIWFDGDDAVAHEAMEVLKKDMLWGIPMAFFVVVFIWRHLQQVRKADCWELTLGVVLSACALGISLVALPAAHVLVPVDKTGIATLLSLFFVSAIAGDMLFVLAACWERGREGRDMEGRVAHMLLHAGPHCLTSSLICGTSFLANLASAVQPVREFGLSMGLAVWVSTLLVLLFWPAILVARGKWQAKHSQVQAAAAPIDASLNTAVLPSAPDQSGFHCVNGGAGFGKGSSSRRLHFNVVGLIADCPLVVTALVVVLTAAFAITVHMESEADFISPDIFAAEHNQVEAKELRKTFAASQPLNVPPRSSGAACRADAWTSAQAAEDCVAYWCDAGQAAAAGETDGSCWLRSEGAPATVGAELVSTAAAAAACSQLDVRARVSAGRQFPQEAWEEMWAQVVPGLLRSTAGAAVTVELAEVGPLAVEAWESGSLEVTTLFEAVVPQTTAVANGKTCEIQVFCYYGGPTCEQEDWSVMGWYNLTQQHFDAVGYSAPAVPSPLRSQLLSTQRSTVTIAYGLRASRYTPLVGGKPSDLWSFDPIFEPDNPWAQRAFYAMCTDLPEELQVVEERCWISHFREWLSQSSGKRFPSRAFDEDLVEWYGSEPAIGQLHLWMVERKMKAMKLEFAVNVRNDIGAERALQEMARWDAYVDRRNRAASVTANRAWHASALWARADSELELRSSAVATAALSAVCGCLAVLLFTGDAILAMLAGGFVVSVGFGTMFFIVTVMAWDIGIVEVMALTALVGHSLTFALQILRKFQAARNTDDDVRKLVSMMRARPRTRCSLRRSPEDKGAAAGEPAKPPTNGELRQARTQLALLHVGGFTFSSAFVFVGCGVFLLPCTVDVFERVGVLVIVATVLSTLLSNTALPAALMLMGPAPNYCGRTLVNVYRVLRRR